MATPCTVSMVAYGVKGVSQPVSLGTGRDDDRFHAGATDEIKVNLGGRREIGALYKIRVWIDGDNEEEEREAAWFLEKVT